MIIAADEALPFLTEAFSEFGEVRPFSAENLDLKAISDADALVVRTITKVNESLLKESSAQFVAAASAGIDHVDQEYLKNRGIGFCYAAGCNADAVSEYIATALHVIAARRNWDLSRKSIAVIGVGHVGSRVAKMALALGMHVLLCDPPLRESTGDGRFQNFEDVLRADILTFHVPLTLDGPYRTWHMVDRKTLEQLSPKQYLINTSRGSVIDNLELKSAILKSKIEGVVLDVWEREPQIDFSLLELADIGTPHIAGISLDGKIRAIEMVREDMCRFFKIRSSWNAESYYPELKWIRPSVSEDRNSILSTLLQAFDIIKSDEGLRGIRTGADFSQLRNQSPLRPEFRHFKIDLGERYEQFADTYAGLGFEVTGK
jgi:erythronate-4-phosphate dehydrogenase